MESTRQLIFTLRFSLLSIFILLFVSTTVLLVSIFVFHINEVALNAALLLLDKTSFSIMYDLNSQLHPAEEVSEFSANNIEEKVIDVTNKNEIIPYLIHILKRIPIAQAAYWGDVQGNFVYAGRQPDGGYLVEILNRRTNPATDNYFFMDNNHKTIKHTTGPIFFDPRNRPWFKLAIEAKRPVWTDVYLYNQTFVGTTVATAAYNVKDQPVGVFGIDVKLETLSQYLSKQKIGRNGEVFIIDSQGKVIASQEELAAQAVPASSVKLKSIKDIFKPYLEDAFAIYKKTSKPLFEFETNDKTYLASFRKLPIFARNGWMISIVDLSSDYTDKIHKVELFYIFIFFCIFLIGIGLMSHLVTLIVKPIKSLVKETEKIKNFDLEGTRKVISRIKEVIELSDAISSMRRGLRSFQRYVPAGLVRQLIKTGEDAEVGGSKRKLAIFFSDIKDFTVITEKYESHKLVRQICEYFEAITRIIIEEKGTIDKYIGDSIMAFWGAPMSVFNPCHHAAEATLRCKKQLDSLNTEWKAKKRPAIATYFGLHFGEVIVGSIGSSERLNYTALGDSVNITSRIVSANKHYGTSILVTETVYQQIKNEFILRFVDDVMFKGKGESIKIYELISDSRKGLLFNVDAFEEKFLEAFAAYQSQKWKKAIALFELCLKIYPKDKVCLVFIERCKKFETISPPSKWKGIWRLTEK